jgi:hypothetical protein
MPHQFHSKELHFEACDGMTFPLLHLCICEKLPSRKYIGHGRLRNKLIHRQTAPKHIGIIHQQNSAHALPKRIPEKISYRNL